MLFGALYAPVPADLPEALTMTPPETPPLEIPTAAREQLAAGALLVVSHSGGKDSQAMTWRLHQALPGQSAIILHAELPGADWPGILEHIEATRPRAWPVLTCSAIHRDGTPKTFDSMVRRRRGTRPDAPSFPSPGQRTCTSDLKTGPMNKAILHYLKTHPEHGGRVIVADGRRADESRDRAKLTPWYRRAKINRAGRQVFDWLPIHGLTEAQVRAVVADAGQALHPAYAAGMRRLSCAFCIFGSEADHRTAARLAPATAARYVALEAFTGYTLSPTRRRLVDILEPSQSELDL